MQPQRSGDVALTLVEVSRDFAIARFHNVIFCHFRGSTPVGCVHTLRGALADHLRQPKAGKPVFFGVIELKSTPPDQEARAAFVKLFEDHAEQLAAAVVVAYGEGFRAAMVRTITSGVLNLMFRVRFPRHIVAAFDEGIRLAAEHAPGLAAAQIAAGFRRLEAQSAP